MSDVRALLRSFGGGEITPQMFGRMDLVKYQSGLALCRNFVTLPHGPAQNRAGLEYIGEAMPAALSGNAIRLLPFVFSDSQSYVLEFGPSYIAFYTNGGAVLEASKSISAITQANPGVFTSNAHGFANGDRVYLATVGGMPTLSNRFYKVANATANTFTLTDLDGANIDTTALGPYTSGGAVARQYAIATTYAAADLAALHFVQSNDVLTLAHPSYATAELKRLGAANWTLTTISFAPTFTVPPTADVTPTGTGGNPLKHRYRVTAVVGGRESTTYMVGRNSWVAISGVTAANPGVVTTAVGHGLLVDQRVVVSEIPSVIPDGEYFVNTVPDATHLTLRKLDGTVLDTTGTAYTTGGKIGPVEATLDLTVAGNSIKVSWSPVAGATEYRVYKSSNNGYFGYIGSVEGGQTIPFLVDNNIIADTSRTPPIANEPFTGAGNYPRAVGYFEQRRVFAGSNNLPQTFVMTRSGTESDLSYSTPTRDDDSITFKIASRQLNTIEHVVPLEDLWLLTSGAEYRVISQNSDALTPFTVSARARTYVGTTSAQPVVAQDACLFASRGGHVREISYRQDIKGAVSDISIYAPHLFDGYTVSDLSYASAPVPIVWCVRSDGKLLGLTYVAEQQVLGWHQHDTDGTILSCTVVREGGEDALYVAVKRNIVARGGDKIFIERMHSRAFTTPADCFFVDCGLTYSGAATTTITNLFHLEGRQVAVLADGATQPPKTVTGGQITLDQASSKVTVGLPITAQLKTLPLALDAEAMLTGRVKNVSNVHIRVHQSTGVFVGPAFDELVQLRQRTTEVYGSPPNLVSGEFEIVPQGDWTQDGAVHVQQIDPLPVTVVHVSLEAAIGG